MSSPAHTRDEARRRADGVTAEAVVFPAAGTPLAGVLYRPGDATGPLPGVVVTGTWTSVREQMADRYAARLAARGYATLAFDHTGYGASGGALRDYESPALKARDISAAVGFLAQRPDAVDAARLAALGVCASAGYTASNAVADPRVRALALVAPWLHDADVVAEAYGGPDGVAERMRAAALARSRYEATGDPGDVEYVPAVGAGDPLAAMPFDLDFYQDPQRGGVPAWPNRFAVMAWPGWLTYDPVALAPRVRQPVLVVHSEQGAIPAGAHRFADALPAPATVEWRDGTQFDFYDGDTHVDDAVDRAAAHFAAHL
ncbi:alpha/beta hydrolase [Geodermatophilus sp. DSM 44513]|uniref:alpha/beta hydrolase n=1 Tax=Geodermatophilus sp. DSM 44513 TaxID=1528104 RepID=UPI00126AB40F|nr:alpha/beta hydrolase [Geodermatophilus sp. DSM 44513]WNV73735.1 alpha/beta hydrolase [Geodermatophilus sp. DSM 44513]